MARKYTSKETKSLIDKHNENLRSLEASLSLPLKIKDQIQNCTNNMNFSGVFSAGVMDSLRGRETDSKDRFGELIKLLYLFKRVTRQSYDCQAVLSVNKNRIVSMLKDVAVGSNAITWLLASSKKKHNFEDAYEILAKEADGSDYWRLSQAIFLSIAGNGSVTETQGWDDFRSNVGEYRDILTENLPSNLRSSELISDLDQLVGRFIDIAADLERETSKTDAIKDGIKASAERMVMATVLDILRTVPVEEINRGKKALE